MFVVHCGHTYITEIEIPKAVKKAQNYVVKKKDYDTLNENDKDHILRELDLIVTLISELQTIREIEKFEDNWFAPINRAYLSEDFFASSPLSD